MAGSVNKVILVGNVGRDPEIRTTQEGKEIATFPVATSESWRDNSTGERKERTEWHRIVIFSQGLVNVVKNYVKKGSKLYIEGSLQTRKWMDNSNVERFTTEVVLQNFNSVLTMIDNRNSGDNSNTEDGFESGYSSNSRNSAAPATSNKNFVAEELNDEIPF